MHKSVAPVPLYIKWLLIAALAVFPVMIMGVNRGGQKVFIFILALGLLTMVLRWKVSIRSFSQLLSRHWPIHLAMSGLFVALILNWIISYDYSLSSDIYSLPLRLASFAFVFWTFMHLTSKELKVIQWGLVGGAITSAVVLLIMTDGGQFRKTRVFDWRLIPYTDFSLLIGYLSLFTIKWKDRSSKTQVFIKMAALCAALVTSYVSETRGAWLAIPFFLFVATQLFIGGRGRKNLVIALIAFAVLAGAFSFSNMVRDRVGLAVSEVVSFMHGRNKDTSVGIRLQLWYGSWLMIKERPVFGVGPKYQEELSRLVQENEISPAAATHRHAHNEILFQTAQYGVFGMIAIISVLFVPAIYFFKGALHSDSELQTTAWMGLALCGGTFIFGLTDVILRWPEASICYVVFMAVLLAHYSKRQQELNIEGVR